MMKRIKYIFALLATVGVMAACVRDNGCNDDEVRVLVVYIGADSNLSGYATEKLVGLQKGWTGKSTDRIIAYVDYASAGAFLYEVSAPEIKQLTAYGKENSASAEVLSRVLNDIVRMYPADNYGLLMFSHATGWLPHGAFEKPALPEYKSGSRSMVVDGKNGIELKDFAEAIPAGVFDYVAFEACLMAGIEVVYELRDKVPYILASSAEVAHPGFEPAYHIATSNLLAGDIVGFARKSFDIVMSYDEDNWQRSATYSVINTAGIDALAEFVKNNCDFSREVDVWNYQRFDSRNYRLFFDFEDYYGSLLPDDQSRAELSQLVKDCIVWKDATPLYKLYNLRIEKHSGLTTYIPQRILPGLNAAYSELEWSKEVGVVTTF